MSVTINTKSKKVVLTRTFDEIEEGEILNSATRTSDTTKQYNSVILKLKSFLKIPEDENIPKEMLTDLNLSLFSHEFGKVTSYHKSQYKKMNGALNWLASTHQLSNYFDFPHDWPSPLLLCQ